MLTIDRAAQVLDYCQRTGVFVWKINASSRRPIGSIAGKIDKDGYRVIRIDGKNYRAGRLAYFMSYGHWPSELIDHVNGDRLDDSLKNLREASYRQNCQNSIVHKNSSSRKKGVDYHKRDGAWRARIRVDGKRVFLGNFPTPELAHAAYVQAASALHGEFART